MRIDVRAPDGMGYFVKRSSSAAAKNALALRRISFARYSSRTSRSIGFRAAPWSPLMLPDLAKLRVSAKPGAVHAG